MSEVFATADLIDAHGEAIVTCETQFRQFGGRTAFYGPIATIKCHEDNAMVKEQLNQPGEGWVLVVDGGGSLRTALMGDLIAQAAFDNGWAGVVINGAVRDTATLAKLDLGIKALGSTPRKSTKTGAGHLDGAVSFGNVVFTPESWLYSDEDGIVVSDEKLDLP
ncbi:S-adenosylmethionine--2-demethylmenaquinone methyltransferase [Nocardiopsis gilva YIM 90087]|uniref:4-hydroxy-4-methyl-2-oxoglutarate aldolase n=1 Tax=Nocardiopsis gilva YIM 90087 TaxID=1235441 RepID=A0A223S205_9ACTN|nr:ribonuclease E activity regulator RraA [Nocardiopsis gilva]ASU82156.1 S-adenosylmethionine--2-demethylmenaquinone methyltransferase [Nocardiopsis gilva YIM 90087]